MSSKRFDEESVDFKVAEMDILKKSSQDLFIDTKIYRKVARIFPLRVDSSLEPLLRNYVLHVHVDQIRVTCFSVPGTI
jgi:hypothetical protein